MPGSPELQPEPCRDRELLRSRYRADLRVYIEAAVRLEHSKDFNRDRIHAERAKIAWEQSRAAFNAHVAEHQCDVQIS